MWWYFIFDCVQLRKEQVWKYRKLFMEIEREQVRALRKKTQHTQQINKIKVNVMYLYRDNTFVLQIPFKYQFA